MLVKLLTPTHRNRVEAVMAVYSFALSAIDCGAGEIQNNLGRASPKCRLDQQHGLLLQIFAQYERDETCWHAANPRGSQKDLQSALRWLHALLATFKIVADTCYHLVTGFRSWSQDFGLVTFQLEGRPIDNPQYRLHTSDAAAEARPLRRRHHICSAGAILQLAAQLD